MYIYIYIYIYTYKSGIQLSVAQCDKKQKDEISSVAQRDGWEGGEASVARPSRALARSARGFARRSIPARATKPTFASRASGSL